MSPRRSKLEITLNILSVIADGVSKPTRIMYAANMSWKPVQEVLSRLVDEGLIEMMTSSGKGHSRRKYMITEKGSRVLEYFNDAKELMQFEGIFSSL
jgi:predicted transcriptional regulator